MVFKADLAVFKADLAVFKADLFGASGGVLGGPHPK